mmetsp:Transcript_104226/g.185170  ORF Transcript_104226/g.185170 Transcript_104226/m.185170 type:complete len:1388 (+) Transcript_104226:71-4234(+)
MLQKIRGLCGGKRNQQPTHFNVLHHQRTSTHGLRVPDAYWQTEKDLNRGCHDRLRKFVDSTFLEVVVSSAIAVDLGLTIASFVLPEDEAESIGIFVSGSIIVAVLLIDALLRLAKDGPIKFFSKLLNWIEFAVAVAGAAGCVIEIDQRLTGSDAGGRNGTSLGRTLRPLLRVFRVFRGFFNFLAGRGGMQARIDRGMDKLVDHIIRKQLGDILLCPGDNISIKPSAGMFHMEKAQVRSENLGQLHLPMVLLAGIFDMVHLELKFGKLDLGHHRLLVVVDSLILVVGPGHHQEPPAPQWSFEAVKATKTNLVKLACRSLETSAKPRTSTGAANQTAAQPGSVPSGSVRRQKASTASWVKRKAQKILKDVLNNGMQVTINNLEIRYEDDESGICGPCRVLGGVRVEHVNLRAVSAYNGSDNQSDEFRAKGSWRPGPGRLAVPVASSTPFKVSQLNIEGLKELARRKVQDFFDFSHGIRGGIQCTGFAVFMDLVKQGRGSVADVVASNVNTLQVTATSRYSHRLKESSGCLVSEFLHQRHANHRWEQVRLAICSHVLERVRDKRITQEGVHLSGQRLREKQRRLRDLVVSHRYLLEPLDISVHCIVHPSKKDGEHPNTDVDILVPEVSMLGDVFQVKALFSTLAYIQRWSRQDASFQWKPPPAEFRDIADISNICALTPARLRWAYALRLVLKAIHPTYPWNCLAWMQMRRVASFRRALMVTLLAPPPVDTKRVEVLQVLMPISEVLSVRKAAYVELATRRAEEKKLKQKNGRARFLALFSREAEAPSAGDVPIDEAAEDADADADELAELEGQEGQERVEEPIVNDKTVVEVPEKSPRRKKRFSIGITGVTRSTAGSSDADKLDMDAALEFAQVHVTIEKMCADLLQEEVPGERWRRAFLRWSAVGVKLLSLQGAPYEIWSGLASPSVVVSTTLAEGLWRQKTLALEVLEGNAVFSAAPVDGPELRSMLSLDRKRKPLSSTEGPRPILQVRATQLAHEQMSLEEAIRSPWGRRGAKDIPPPWHVAACVEPVAVNLCKTLLFKLKNIMLNILSVPDIDAASKTEFAAQNSAQLEDPYLLWVKLEQLRAARKKRLKQRKFLQKIEIALGQRGPMSNGQRFSGQVLFPGGLRASLVDAYDTNRWVAMNCSLPPGSQEFNRSGWPVELIGGYRAVSGVENIFRAADGWWFETEEQAAQLARARAQGGAGDRQLQGKDDWLADVGVHSSEHAPRSDEAGSWAWANATPDGLLGSPPNYSAHGLPMLPPDVKPKIKEDSFGLLALACPAPVAASAAVVAASIVQQIPGGDQCSKADSTDLEEQPLQSPSLPSAPPLEMLQPIQWRDKLSEETDPWAEALSVSLEVLPRGGFGLIAPCNLDEWWNELGLTPVFFHE